MSAEELAAQAAEQLMLHEKENELRNMKLQEAKQKQTSALQEKLNAKLKKRQEQKEKQDLVKAQKKEELIEVPKVEAPAGEVTFAVVKIKGTASILESSDEEAALRTIDDIQAVLNNQLIAHNIYKVKEEIGTFLLASNTIEDMINFSIELQLKFNENKWSDALVKLPAFRKLFRPEDASSSNAVPLFNGPRLTFGIHRGEASSKVDGTGHTSYSGINVVKVESIGNVAQGGQVILSSSAWEGIDQSKILSEHHVTQLGIYKLEGFSAGCKLVEILPNKLKDRSKYFGSVCAHCSEVIQPSEKFFRALDCIWHMNHFRCFQCNVDLEGSYIEHESSPYCKNCYLIKNAPKCKNCSNPITAGYVNALGGYWHTDCFSCKSCLKKASAEVSIYEYEGYPYCADCYQKVASS